MAAGTGYLRDEPRRVIISENAADARFFLNQRNAAVFFKMRPLFVEMRPFLPLGKTRGIVWF